MEFSKQRDFFASGQTRSIEFRLKTLKRFLDVFNNYESMFIESLKADLNKPDFETHACELLGVRLETKKFIKNLRKWSKPQKASTGMENFPSKGRLIPEPHGLCLIMSPWNYPVLLSLVPLIGAIAAGNTVVLKPSNYSYNTSKVIELLIKDVFLEQHVCTILGGREAISGMLEEKFDYIFFTGSVESGKMIMEKASKHLTPVTLELGGKSPCIVDKTANIDVAAKRIVWGKFVNSGQTCIAPDYIFCHRDVKEDFITCLKKHIVDFYYKEGVLTNDFPKIINQKHFERVQKLIDKNKVIFGGNVSSSTSVIEPTILDNVSPSDLIMQEEIFAPIMPIMTFADISETINYINSKQKPLALYIFSNSDIANKVISRTSSGGACVNDTIMHVSAKDFPFGGVGSSGIGRYHGKYSFETFSHIKPVLYKSIKFELKMKYPPYDKKENTIKFIKKM